MSIKHEVPEVTPTLAQEMIRELVEAGSMGVPLFLWGPPGVGKSSLVREVAREMNIGFIDLRLVQLDPVDVRGLPYVVDDPANPGHKMMGFAPPTTLPRSGRGILFLDELPQAQSLVQNAVSELVLDRRCGDYQLPEGWIIVAAGNRRQDRAATQEMPSHLKNRFSHISIDPRFSDWASWAKEINPNTGETNIEPRLLAFLTSQPNQLNQFNPDALASPTSRSWEFVSKLMRAIKGSRARNAAIQGAIGKHTAAALITFLNDSDDIPTIEQIVGDPMTAPIPESQSARSAVASNLADQCGPDQANAVATYLSRLAPEDQIVALVTVMSRKDYAAMLKADKMRELAISHELISAE